MEKNKAILAIKENKDLRVKLPSLMRPEVNLYDFQHPAVAMMYVQPKMAIGFDVGLGKTLISIATYALVREKQNFKGPMYVFTTRSAIYQWKSEVEKFSTLKPFVVDAACMSKKKRQDFYTNKWGEYDVIISTYSLMYRDFVMYSKYLPSVFLVWDEVMTLKNKDTKLYKLAKDSIAKVVPRLYGLSATLLKNTLLEPYYIYKLIAPKPLPPTFTKFRKEYCIVQEDKIWIKKKGYSKASPVIIKNIVGHKNIKGFYNRISPYYIGCKKEDIKADNLPKLAIKPIWLYLEGEQKKLYKQVLDGFLGSVESGEEIKFMISKMIRCQQICDAPSVLGFDVPSVKEKELKRLLTEDIEESTKSVVFSRLKQVLYHLEKEIVPEYNPLVITGDVSSSKKREALKHQFNTNAENKLMLISTAGREALNLQVAGSLVFYNLDWSFADIWQVIGRIYRLGSSYEFITVYIFLIKDTIDEYIYNLAVKKEGYFTEFSGGTGYSIDPEGQMGFAQGFRDFSQNL
jgi:SNF2 family DNA or RNA helicase